jgi:hypothetical protein
MYRYIPWERDWLGVDNTKFVKRAILIIYSAVTSRIFVRVDPGSGEGTSLMRMALVVENKDMVAAH